MLGIKGVRAVPIRLCKIPCFHFRLMPWTVYPLYFFNRQTYINKCSPLGAKGKFQIKDYFKKILPFLLRYFTLQLILVSVTIK